MQRWTQTLLFLGFWLATALSTCALRQTAVAQVVVIAHKSTPVAALENDKVLDIYTLNMKNWSDGGKITVLEVRGDSPTKARFYAALGTSFAEMQKLWLKKQFAGKGLPPTTLPSEEDIAQRVASTPGAIGYVSVDKVPKDVKVLAKL